jgi:hypothetical protein
MEKTAFNRKRTLFTRILYFNCVETWTLRKVDQEYLESFEMWCWIRMEKISWADRVRNGEVLHRVKEKGNIRHTIKIRRDGSDGKTRKKT